MHRHMFRIINLLLVAVLLAACEKKPATVSEISGAFWQAVISDDREDMVAYSTLPNSDGYDRFGRGWEGQAPTFGQIVIDGDVARVETQIAKPDAQPTDTLYFETYLVNKGEGWRVDYQRTADAVGVSGTVVDFVGQLTSLGQNIQRQVEASSESAARQIAAFVGQLEQMAGEYQNQTNKAIDAAAGRMQGLLDEFVRSLEDAVKELQEPGEQTQKQGTAELP